MKPKVWIDASEMPQLGLQLGSRSTLGLVVGVRVMVREFASIRDVECRRDSLCFKGIDTHCCAVSDSNSFNQAYIRVSFRV